MKIGLIEKEFWIMKIKVLGKLHCCRWHEPDVQLACATLSTIGKYFKSSQTNTNESKKR